MRTTSAASPSSSRRSSAARKALPARAARELRCRVGIRIPTSTVPGDRAVRRVAVRAVVRHRRYRAEARDDARIRADRGADDREGLRIGYGSTFSAQAPMRIGVVACGYADGYPRVAPEGTPVIVDGIRTRIVGRVSMDMITVDLTPCPQAGVGARVEQGQRAADRRRRPPLRHDRLRADVRGRRPRARARGIRALRVAKQKTVYVCSECGGQTPKWQGQCPSCHLEHAG